jgi:hypothetical protein
MPGPIRLYISSSPELSLEREVVGQTVAAMPLRIGWQISHTSRPGQLWEGEGARTEECDLYALILGHDFAAPMGAELRSWLARGRTPLGAYRRVCNHSPSAQDALRTLEMDWQRFTSVDGFRDLFRDDLLRALLGRAAALGLELDEIERLTLQSQGSKPKRAQGTDLDRRRSDAGQSGRILGREVWESDLGS